MSSQKFKIIKSELIDYLKISLIIEGDSDVRDLKL